LKKRRALYEVTKTPTWQSEIAASEGDWGDIYAHLRQVAQIDSGVHFINGVLVVCLPQIALIAAHSRSQQISKWQQITLYPTADHHSL